MSKEAIKILLLEDDYSIAEGYKEIWQLKSLETIKNVHIAGNEKEFFDALIADKNSFNLFVLDLKIGGNPIKGYNILKELDVKNPDSLYHNIPVVILTALHNDLSAAIIKSIWKCGAKGILGKDVKSDELITIFKKIVFEGAELIDSPSIRKIVYSDENNSYINDVSALLHYDDEKLSKRQKQILRYWCAGWTDIEIANQITKIEGKKITDRAIQGHISKIRAKCYPLHSPLEVFLTIITHNIDESIKETCPEFIRDILELWNNKMTTVKSKRR